MIEDKFKEKGWILDSIETESGTKEFLKWVEDELIEHWYWLTFIGKSFL